VAGVVCFSQYLLFGFPSLPLPPEGHALHQTSSLAASADRGCRHKCSQVTSFRVGFLDMSISQMNHRKWIAFNNPGMGSSGEFRNVDRLGKLHYYEHPGHNGREFLLRIVRMRISFSNGFFIK
jgi:hypothetical protein